MESTLKRQCTRAKVIVEDVARGCAAINAPCVFGFRSPLTRVLAPARRPRLSVNRPTRSASRLECKARYVQPAGFSKVNQHARRVTGIATLEFVGYETSAVGERGERHGGSSARSRRPQTRMDMVDRSRFIDRIVMDPNRVMETSSSSSHGPVGMHADGNLDFLKNAVDLGVSGISICDPSRQRRAADRRRAGGPRRSRRRAGPRATAHRAARSTTSRCGHTRRRRPLGLAARAGGAGAALGACFCV